MNSCADLYRDKGPEVVKDVRLLPSLGNKGQLSGKDRRPASPGGCLSAYPLPSFFGRLTTR